MNNLFLLIAFLGATTFAKTQGNLQFNQVKLVSTVETVPAGKVWKVESCAYNGGAPFSSGTANYSINPPQNSLNRGFDAIMSYSVNGSNINIPCSFILSFTTTVFGTNSLPAFYFPFWLPAGSTLAAGSNMRFLNVIEFNVVP